MRIELSELLVFAQALVAAAVLPNQPRFRAVGQVERQRHVREAAPFDQIPQDILNATECKTQRVSVG